jgi:magnesium chelatase family protein
MLVKTFCAEVMGLEATTITIEVNMTRGVMFHLSGLADTAVKESYDRIRAAITNIGFKPPTAELTINLSPADIRKEGSGYDLPLAIGILAAHGKVSDTMLSEYMMIGELGLDGKLKPVSGVLSVAIRARKEQFKGLLVPHENVREAAVVNNLDVYGMDNLSDVISFLNGNTHLEPTFVDTRKEFYEHQYNFDLDFADVKGQESVKRALEIAAAGGHNIIKISANSHPLFLHKS